MKTEPLKLRLLGDRIIVEPVKVEEAKSKGGLILPKTSEEAPLRGIVFAVGPGKIVEKGSRQDMEVKLYDVILYSKYSGTEVEIKGTKYLWMREEDVIGIEPEVK